MKQVPDYSSPQAIARARDSLGTGSYIVGSVSCLDRDQVRHLREEGKSLREISDAMGLSLTTTARILKTA